MKKCTQYSPKKEVSVMNTAVRLQAADLRFLADMDAYLQKLKQQQSDSPKQACKEAKDALYRTGVTTKKGKLKKKIVSWE